jgi:hypothetical protein
MEKCSVDLSKSVSVAFFSLTNCAGSLLQLHSVFIYFYCLFCLFWVGLLGARGVCENNAQINAGQVPCFQLQASMWCLLGRAGLPSTRGMVFKINTGSIIWLSQAVAFFWTDWSLWDFISYFCLVDHTKDRSPCVNFQFAKFSKLLIAAVC